MFHTFFSLTTGIEETLFVPDGTRKEINEHRDFVINKLLLNGSKREHWHWAEIRDASAKVTDEVLCEVAEKHSRFVRWLYIYSVPQWKPEPGEKRTEILTPVQAAKFWHVLSANIDVAPERWTADYYAERMRAVYAALTDEGDEMDREGVKFCARKLTSKQADEVIAVFSQFLDKHDIRLMVPNGKDYLARGDMGEYSWCDICGAVDKDDVRDKALHCRKRGCSIKEEFGEEYRDR